MGNEVKLWDTMTFEENLEFTNGLLENGKAMYKIEEENYGVGRDTIVGRFGARGYKRSKTGKKLFVLQDAHNIYTNVEEFNNAPKEAKNKPKKATDKAKKVEPKAIFTDEEVAKLKELLNRHDDIVDMLGMYNKCNTTHIQQEYNTSNIQIIHTHNTKQRMFRIDVEVLDRWNEFCRKYEHIKVQNLISSALLNFIELYDEE